jgi:hypothetical protein
MASAAKRTELIHEIIALLEAKQIESAKKKLTKMVTKRSERAPSAYNLFVGHAIKVDEMKMKEAVAAWGSMSEKDKEKWVKLADSGKTSNNKPNNTEPASSKKKTAPAPAVVEDSDEEEESEPEPEPKKKAAPKKAKK